MVGETLKRADRGLIGFFMRLSHPVDYRFHVNQFALAGYAMSAGIAMFAAQSVQDVIRNWRIDMPAVFSVTVACLLCVSFFFLDIARLRRASEDYERHPAQVSREAAHYFLMPFLLRLMLLFLGTLVAGVLTFVDLTTRRASLPYFIENFWLILAGCSWYIAGGLPPRRSRRKKTARAPALVTPQRA